jgi:hypothetical protein
MAIRYSFILIPDPAFLRVIHTARQILCNQFGCWTAEMFMLHMPLIQYFEEQSVINIERSDVIINALNNYSNFEWEMAPQEITISDGPPYDLKIKCKDIVGGPFNSLRTDLAQQFNLKGINPEYSPCIQLLENFETNTNIIEEAYEMAKDLFDNFGLDTPFALKTLQLVKYESKLAGENWEQKHWSSDISWDILDSFRLR